MPLIRGEKVNNWRKEVVSEWHTNRSTTIQPARMMRTEKYKYIVYRENEDEELYDLERDPGEMNNLSRNIHYSDILETMRQQFKQYVAEQVDPFFTQEALIDHRWRQHKIGYQHHKGDSSIDLYLRNIRPLENSGDVKAVEKAKKMVLDRARKQCN